MENNKKQIKAETNYMGMNMKIYSDFSMTIKKKNLEQHFDSDFLNSMLQEYKNVNRIYKPIPLVFWTDVKNGKGSNWKLEETIDSLIYNSLKKQTTYKKD